MSHHYTLSCETCEAQPASPRTIPGGLTDMVAVLCDACAGEEEPCAACAVAIGPWCAACDQEARSWEIRAW
mgnify:CR=1 FL=1